MLKGLRKLFASEPARSGGTVTLADVLKYDWLELWYQPKIELKTLRLTGAEGLARARHPTRGVLAPGVFLPHASEADMLALTERVIITALRDWDDCAEQGMSVKFNVNVPVSAPVSRRVLSSIFGWYQSSSQSYLSTSASVTAPPLGAGSEANSLRRPFSIEALDRQWRCGRGIAALCQSL